MRGMNRKGFLGDLGTLITVLFVMALLIIIGIKVFDDFNTRYQASDASNASKDISSSLETRYSGLWDGIFITVFALLAIALIVSVAVIGSQPHFFFITIIVGIFIIGAAAAVSNAYSVIGDGSILSSAVASLTYVPLIMNNLAEIVLFLLAILVAGMFAKARGVI